MSLRVLDCYWTDDPGKAALIFIDVRRHLANPGDATTLCGLDPARGFWEELEGDYGYWRDRASGWCRKCQKVAA